MPPTVGMSTVAKRASLLALGNDADDDEQRRVREAESATRSKASGVALFKAWLLS